MVTKSEIFSLSLRYTIPDKTWDVTIRSCHHTRKPTHVKLGTTIDELANCKPSDIGACKTQPAHTHLEKQFNHPNLAKLQRGTFANWFLDKEKQFNETYQTISRILKIEKTSQMK